MQQGQAYRAEGATVKQALIIVHGVDRDIQIGWGQAIRGFFGPLDQLETRLREKFAKAGIFPFPGVVEAVKIEVADLQTPRKQRARRHVVRFDDGVGRALDATLHTQGTQEVAHQGGLTGPQVAMQPDQGVADFEGAGQSTCHLHGGRFIRTGDAGFLQGSRWGHSVPTILTFMIDAVRFVTQIRSWGRDLGFSQIGVAGIDLTSAEPGLLRWLEAGFHGEMLYMASHGLKRARPAELVPGTVSVITARMDYLPAGTPDGWQAVEWARFGRPDEGVVSLYARGRDYHKVLRQRLQKLADRMQQALDATGTPDAFHYRVFTDSAPVLEVELATRSGQGWRGKHTLTLDRHGGSMFFLGEVFVNLALPPTAPVSDHCGQCEACITACPTGAIVAPYRLDARRCISYLTIEHAGPIPEALRPLIGNRIYGCDDCQLACPWNKFAQRSALPDFDDRDTGSSPRLIELFRWSEAEFLRHTEGTAIRRIGHERWLRNLAVAMGNALAGDCREEQAHALRVALGERLGHPAELVREHVAWALRQAG